MRVLLDCRMASWSGVGRYTTDLARALAARGDVDLVQIHSAGGSPPVAPRQGAEVVAAEAHPFGVRGAFELGRLVSKAKPDLVHCPHFPTPIPATHPLVVTLHDLSPLIVPLTMPSSLRRAAYWTWNARAVAVADRVLASSRHTACDIALMFPAAGRKLRVVLESADGFADGPVAEIPEGLVLAGERYLLSMGNTKPHKHLPTLLRAFARVAPAWPGLRLLLVGPEVPDFLASVLGGDEAGDRVRFTGRVTDEVLRALYREAAAFVFPSGYEGFGLPPLEAMACGTPVVCSDAASLPEVVGNAALVFPVGDVGALSHALSLVLGDAATHERLSRAGRKRAARFTWEAAADGTFAVYCEALDRFRPRRGVRG